MKSIVLLVTMLAVSGPSLSVSAANDGLGGDRVDPLVSLMSEIRSGDSSVITLDKTLVRDLFEAPRRAPLADTPTLVLSKQSVKVTVSWRNLYVDPPTTGTATALQQDDTYGFFYFFGASNPEVLVKVLDGFPDGKYRVFYAGLTTLEFTVNVQVYCGATLVSGKTFSKPFDAPGTSTNTGGTDGTLTQGCQTTPFPLASGVSSVNGAGGAVTIVGGGSTTVSAVGSTITVSSTGGSSLPSGTTGQTLRFNGTALASSSALTNNGTDVGITGKLTLGGTLAAPNSWSITTAASKLLTSNDSGIYLGKDSGAALTSGTSNAALGSGALQATTTASYNTAVGAGALSKAATNNQNVAVGVSALTNLASGTGNTAVGENSLVVLTSSSGNSTLGSYTLNAMTSGEFNTALGTNSLIALTAGSYNLAAGLYAGANLTTGTGNLYLLSPGPASAGSESNTTRIGDSQTRAFIKGIRGVTTGSATGIPVLIDTNGQLGTVSSSRRFKDDIADMGAASERIFELRPVTFRYKAHAGQENATQYGLVAEEVDGVMPGLVARSADGEIETVRYHDLPVLLLNELQKMVRRVEELEREVASLRAERDR